MRHHKTVRKFGRTRNLRNALMKTLATSLITVGKIKTTTAKAKELRPYMEKLITLSKKENIASRRLIVSRIGDNSAAKKLFLELGKEYKDRNGGYTRVIKLPNRKKDASPMSVIELV